MTNKPAHKIKELLGYQLNERIGVGGYGEVWSAVAPGGLMKAVKLVYGYHDENRASLARHDPVADWAVNVSTRTMTPCIFVTCGLKPNCSATRSRCQPAIILLTISPSAANEARYSDSAHTNVLGGVASCEGREFILSCS